VAAADYDVPHPSLIQRLKYGLEHRHGAIVANIYDLTAFLAYEPNEASATDQGI
jgi:hypothetical protein